MDVLCTRHVSLHNLFDRAIAAYLAQRVISKRQVRVLEMGSKAAGIRSSTPTRAELSASPTVSLVSPLVLHTLIYTRPARVICSQRAEWT